MEFKNAYMVLLKKEVIKMPFKDGIYQHESGFTVMVNNGVVMLSPNHPLSIRLSELFDTSKWKGVK